MNDDVHLNDDVHPDVADLLTLVPADFAGGERIDWDAAEAALGTRLPSDYKSVLDVYGMGDIDDLVLVPALPSSIPAYADFHMATQTAELHILWESGRGIPGVTLGPEALLPWGTGMNANETGWLMNDPDPDRWPVVAWRRHHSGQAWALFECGMARFLTRMMRGEFEECPLGHESLWNRTGTFVSWREQGRRYVAGLDPKTGEPDPFAGMYPVDEAAWTPRVSAQP
ncbi:hypothetical protein GCM10010329_33440 [Streptomyces spiroverticillatus]|uniref:SMI1/KNR4 family protein n=1 Tax=Streptomyces finlayi TaxID=67296 RepID=A0A919CA44_9ACTN|nr:SMI1/KNR4 family protein [Streptomyces finlayi]GHA08013.1 hypothetical protein GCM10010329_33440 [Streptomyces spiroverticillatus]GHC91116.1 hypothetical protein GCM10010334_25850 [Streptomyces finlayi]